MNLLALLQAAERSAPLKEGDSVYLTLRWRKEYLEGGEIELQELADLFDTLRLEFAILKNFCETVRSREQAWRDNEGLYGASIEDCIMFLRVQVSDLKRDKSKGAAYIGVTSKLLLNCIMRLEELQARRKAGGATPSEAERRRETDSKAWREEEEHGDKRREQQERDRFRTSGRRDYDRAAGEQLFEEIWEEFAQTDFDPQPTSSKASWWQVLALHPNATVAEIKTAARKLRAQYHPDRYKGEDAHVRMAEINVAVDQALFRRSMRD